MVETQAEITTNEFKAIDPQESGIQIRSSLQYVEETRGDFEKEGVPLPCVTQLVSSLEKTNKAIERLSIEHVEDLVEWKDELGVAHAVLVREQDELLFDEIVATYKESERLFADYFQKHIELIKGQK